MPEVARVAEAVGHGDDAGAEVGVEAHLGADGAVVVAHLGDVARGEAEPLRVVGVHPERVRAGAARLQLLDVLQRGVDHVRGAPRDQLELTVGLGLEVAEQVVPALRACCASRRARSRAVR